MKFINTVPILYYELSVSPGRVREALPSAFEFKNPSPESFSIVPVPGKNEGLLVIDVRDENRYVFVLPLKENLILINETLPRVFVIPKKGLREFFGALAENDLERMSDRGWKRKARKWRLLIDGVATLVVGSLSTYFHAGLWGALLLGVIFTTVEQLLGRESKGRYMMTEVNKKTVRRMYEVSEKKGNVVRVSL
ncbi:hypothetical protein [Thermococcus sp.]|uniref:hypothetical protein n=1 Tax=Thermococcus sp. TaxID=35749 RepID=UPI0025F6644E|nr:hypothetical protein [Thermococcus sp.]